ncbi:MAG: hypothetical protein ACE5FO_08225 [Parvularculaceae bacterium]
MTKPSWLFWVVAVLAVLWNGFGVVDYWLTSTGNEEYLKDFDPKIIDWIVSFPLWRDALWIVSVVAGALGGVALILRMRWAALLFLINFVTLVLGFVGHDLLLANGVEMYGQLGLAVSVVIVALSAFFWWYARRALRLGYIA